MMGTQYLSYEVAPIPDKEAFLRESGITGVITLRKILTEIRRLLIIPDKQVLLFAIGDHVDGFRIDAYGGKQNKEMLARFYYLPSEKVFDIYDPEAVYNGSMPLFGWRNRKLEFKGYSSLLQVLKVEKVFSSLISLI